MLKQFQKKLRTQSTKPEYILWQYLRDRKLDGCKFRRQQVIHKFIVDFVCYEKKLIIELDGLYHQYQLERDLCRTSILEQEGFCILRFWNEDVLRNINGVLGVIRDVLKKAPLIRPTGTFSHKGRRVDY